MYMLIGKQDLQVDMQEHVFKEEQLLVVQTRWLKPHRQITRELTYVLVGNVKSVTLIFSSWKPVSVTHDDLTMTSIVLP